MFQGLQFSFFLSWFFSLSSFKGGGLGVGFISFFRFSFSLVFSEQLSERGGARSDYEARLGLPFAR